MIEELARHPVQFSRNMAAFVQVGMHLPMETDHEGRNRAPFPFDNKANTATGLHNLSAEADQPCVFSH